MLLKHHPTVSDLSVTIQLKDLKKVLRTVCLFKGLRELGVHVKGGSKVHFSFRQYHLTKLVAKKF